MSNTSVNRQSNWSRLYYAHLSSKFESKQITLDLWIHLWPTELMSWVTLIDNLHQKTGKTPLTLLLVIEPWNIIWLQCQRVVVGVARKQCYRDIAGLLVGRLGIVEEVVGALRPQERVKVHLETVQDTDLLPGFKRLNW